jgi:hypothetical protein
MTPAGWIALHLPQDELAGWDIDELRRVVAVGIEQLDRGEYLEVDSEDELLQIVLAKVDARAAKRRQS